MTARSNGIVEVGPLSMGALRRAALAAGEPGAGAALPAGCIPADNI
jgi:hypothetical protein